MAYSHHIGLHHLPPMLKAFRGTHPDIEPELRFLDPKPRLVRLSAAMLIALVTLDQPTQACGRRRFGMTLGLVCGSVASGG